MNWPLRLRTQWHDLQSALWFRPAWITAIAVLLALTITTVDQLPYFAAPALLRIGADSARAVLGAIAGAMLAVVGMIFSILMVVLVLVSQQFSPRILRNFARDRISQNVLGLFIGSFTYSLLVLARISEHEDRVFTPVLSVTVAIVLAIVAISSFIYFIDHITRTVRVSYIVADINHQTETLLQRLYEEAKREQSTSGKEAADEEAGLEDAPLVTAEATHIHSPRAGHIQTIDYRRLLQLATENNWVIQVEHLVGDFVTREGLLLSLMPGQKISQEMFDALYGAFDIGTERTLFGDVLFGIRQLVDIALKAISPGINDPTTAANALDYLGNILIFAVRHADVSGRFYDEKGRLRVVAPRPTFITMIDLAFDQIRHYSSREPTISLRMLEVLVEIAQATSDRERHAAVWRHTAMISRNVAAHILEPHDRARLNQRLREIAAVTGGDLRGIELDHAEAPERLLPRDGGYEEAQAGEQTDGADGERMQDEASHI